MNNVLRQKRGRWDESLILRDHPEFVPDKKGHPAINVQILPALKQRIVDNGISVRDDELLPGADRFYVDDPFGNRLEFLKWMDYSGTSDDAVL